MARSNRIKRGASVGSHLASLVIVALSAVAIALCTPPPKQIPVDLDGLEVVRKVPFAHNVPVAERDALWRAAFQWIAENDPPESGDRAVYLSVVNAESVEGDLPAPVMATARFAGHVVRPLSSAPNPVDRRIGEPPGLHYTVGFPRRRSADLYEVVYGVDCTPACQFISSLFLRQDADGWHVAWRQFNAQR